MKTPTLIPCLTAAAIFCCSTFDSFAQLFSDDFDSIASPVTVSAPGTNAGYKIVYGTASGARPFTAIFGFDYSTVTYPLAIPPAPNSVGGTTKGLYLTVNKDASTPLGGGTGGAASLNLYPTNKSFSGNFSLKFDLWMNWTNLPTSTEHAVFGINHSGNVINRIGAAGSDGVFFAMAGDGGASATSTAQRDYSCFRGNGNAAPVLLLTNNTAFGPEPPLGPQFDNANPGFVSLFPSILADSYSTLDGTPGLQWVQCEVRYELNVVTWFLNGTVVAQFTNTFTPNYGSGNILIGYCDAFASIGDVNNFAIFDNIRVESLGGPPLVSVTSSIPTTSEGGAAGGFTISRTGDTSGALTVNYTISGTATDGLDYTNNPPSGSVTLLAGATSTNISVNVIDDNVTEPIETVILTINDGSGYAIGAPSAATVAILDNEPATLSINSAQPILLESFVGSRASFTVTRQGLTNSALTATLSYTGSAAAGVDFTGPASVNLAAGAITATATLSPIDDQLFEGAETAVVNVISNGLNYVVGSPSSAAITIVEDELPAAPVLFADTFDTEDSLNNWNVNLFNEGYADFGFDYSTVGIPEAPSSAGTFAPRRGLKMRANETLGDVGGLSVSPINGNFEGDYRLRFDMWLNYAGPLNNANVPGQTQSATAGVGTSGTFPVLANSGDCIWFTATCDGGSAAFSGDYNAYSANGLFADDSGVYAAGTTSGPRDNLNAYYSLWTGVSAPAAQTNLFPTQTGSTATGSFGMTWHAVTVTKLGNEVTWDVDGRRIATVDISNSSLGGANVLLGYFDPFASLTTNSAVQFGLFDNVRVESLAPSITITGIQLIDGGANVQIDFTASSSDTESSFALQASGVVDSGYDDVSATITTQSPGVFRAVLAVSGTKQFYRIRHQ